MEPNPQLQVVVRLLGISGFKPSAHSTIFVVGNRDLVFCRQ